MMLVGTSLACTREVAPTQSFVYKLSQSRGKREKRAKLGRENSDRKDLRCTSETCTTGGGGGRDYPEAAYGRDEGNILGGVAWS